MPTLVTVLRRHGTARSGKLGPGARMIAMRLQGDPGFGSFLKRAFTPPKALRGLARAALPIVGGMVGGPLGAGTGSVLAGSGAKGTGMGMDVSGFGPLDPLTLTKPLDMEAYKATAKKISKAHKQAVGIKVHRRINWSNPRALGRAERRLTSFIKHFSKNARHLGFHVSRGPRGHAALPRRKR